MQINNTFKTKEDAVWQIELLPFFSILHYEDSLNPTESYYSFTFGWLFWCLNKIVYEN
tara:strand:+ start:4889 stop:5062 length:174 start_codon:yes stop_codon:yes gene_type:complete